MITHIEGTGNAIVEALSLTDGVFQTAYLECSRST